MSSIPSATSSVLVTASRSIQTGRTEGERLIENRHHGWAAACCLAEATPVYCTPGADRIAIFFRSSAKPFQALPLVAAGYHEALSPEELAVICASHTGSFAHLNHVAAVLEKAGLTESALQCGPHMPLDFDTAAALQASGMRTRPIHNNCSGKHAGMLYYCVRAGLPTESYLEPTHPLQAQIVSVLRQYGGFDHDIPLAVDGCGAPVFYLPLATMARLYACLATHPDFTPIRKAMLAHPALVGGDGRIDSVLMQASRGGLIAKAGADGVLCVGNLEQARGVAVKIADGCNEARNLAVAALLKHLGWLDDAALADLRLASYLDARRLNTQGQPIGDWRFHFD